jgi:lipoprotein-anchoring transpeptidase ErfK/SrfK
MTRASIVGVLVVGALLVGTSVSFGLDLDSVNGAQFSAKPAKSKASFDPVMLKAQVLLDRAFFSPGEIDGHAGDNFKKAVASFQAQQHLPTNGHLDADAWDELAGASTEPVLVEYTLKQDDVKGPFIKKLPARLDQLEGLDHLGYTSAREAIAEKFHMSEKLLQALNPGKRFDQAGETVVVADVRTEAPQGKAARVEIDKPRKILKAYSKDDRLLAVFPASIGSKEKPAPTGRYTVTSVARNPTYKYNPEYHFKGVKANRPFTVKPGPNNPVGSVWINLSLKGYGIHGTPEPGKIGKTESHGCIRLTNWDANTLASMVVKGAVVEFLDSSPDGQASAELVGTDGKSSDRRAHKRR